MDMTHITEFHTGSGLQMDAELPLQMGAGSVDPDLIAPTEKEIDIEELVAAYTSL